MGTDCAPFLANLFLFYYEYMYMKELIKNNIIMARKFNCTMRYIDDLLALNNKNFEGAISDIYPPELQLKKTTECSTTTSYLDMLITINDGTYSTTIYDKRDSFGFEVVNFPYMSSNIPTKPAYGVYISQLIRIGRICSTFEQFRDRHHKLTQRLIKQGFWYSGLCAAFKKFARSHADIFYRYGCSIMRHIEECQLVMLSWVRMSVEVEVMTSPDLWLCKLVGVVYNTIWETATMVFCGLTACMLKFILS